MVRVNAAADAATPPGARAPATSSTSPPAAAGGSAAPQPAALGCAAAAPASPAQSMREKVLAAAAELKEKAGHKMAEALTQRTPASLIEEARGCNKEGKYRRVH